jgi:hypothetical protein
MATSASATFATPDFTVENHGSLFLVHCNTDAAYEHLVAHVSDEAQWTGRRLAVEPRYIVDLVAALHDAGFAVD